MAKKTKKIRKLEDDERLPASLWFFAGGDQRYKPPTGAELRAWKKASDGDWPQPEGRGFWKEFAFVMSRGKKYHNMPVKKEKTKKDKKGKKEKKEKKKKEDEEKSRKLEKIEEEEEEEEQTEGDEEEDSDDDSAPPYSFRDTDSVFSGTELG